MADPARQLRVNAIELLRQPGATRHIEYRMPAEALGVAHPALDGDIGVDVVLEALNDGIAVRGSVAVGWSGVCRRCLVPLRGVDTVAVDELYQRTLIDPDAFLIEDGQLDLNPLVRETALLALDDERLCRDTCAGLCPYCGVDRNEHTCDCVVETRDDRWAALDDLLLDSE